MQINIDWKSIENQVKDLAIQLFNGYTKQALADLKIFRTQTEDDLKTWVLELKRGEITVKNFENLVLGQKDLLELEALKQAGLAEIALDKFTDGLLNIVFSVAKSAIKF